MSLERSIRRWLSHDVAEEAFTGTPAPHELYGPNGLLNKDRQIENLSLQLELTQLKLANVIKTSDDLIKAINSYDIGWPHRGSDIYNAMQHLRAAMYG